MDCAISVTGLGIMCAIGNDAQSVLDSLRAGKSGIRAMKYLRSKHSELPVGEVQMSNEEMKALLGLDAGKTVSRTSLMGAICVRQALEQAGITGIEGKRVVLISGTTVGDMDVTEKYFSRMLTDDSLLHLPHSNECGTSSLEIASMAGLGDARVCTISTACSSALNSIIVGAGMLRRDEADIVVAGGAEALSRFHLNGFNTLMILDKRQCRPFDRDRAGLNLGEGAAFVVLEKNAPDSLAYVSGYGNRCDAFHQTASSENGEGAYLAMTEALAMAGLKCGEIQYVNAHGTGTQNNDRSESHALKRVFAGALPEISSTKGFTGHTTSASGAIETVICILSMLNGFTPANYGWNASEEGGIVPTMGSKDVVLDNVMCNSFGFGGNDSSIILTRNRQYGTGTGPQCRSTDCDGIIVAAEELVSSRDELPALKEFIPPMESRRMGKLMKAAMLASLRALKKAGLAMPDAIVTATSRGMLETSQQFMMELEANDEEQLKPTLFMQSTHNTVGSAIAIHTGCHGYNITYSQGDESEEWAMLDAGRLITRKDIASVLVCSFDESTPIFDSLSERSGEPVPDGLKARSIILVRKDGQIT